MSNQKPKPISFSEFYTWKYKNEEYYESYVLGIRQPANRAMILGSICHAGAEGKPWLKMLRENFFTANYERTVKMIVEHERKQDVPKREVWFKTNLGEFEVYGVYDGLDEEIDKIHEMKTGSALWTQERVDESEQITLYFIGFHAKYGKLPKGVLRSYNVNNGRCAEFPTKRTLKQMEALKNELQGMYNDLKSRGWREARQSSFKK